jgi:2-polyprenyl-3-methyl-5-hydroxy-6-metoxy-1,4-benzoquinol methylase
MRCLLENVRVADIGLERFLTAARSVLLEAARAGTQIDDDAFAFYCALARQCFTNEYVYAHSDDELRQAESLRRALTDALRDETPIPPILPVAVAAYFPLHAVERSEKLLTRSWPDAVDAVMTQQVREPQEELRLRANMPRLTPVEDEVSLLVQRQYEENPYPRWVKVAPSGKAADINTRMHSQFPYSAFRDVGAVGKVDVLLAGCGTGQQVVDVAMRIVGSRVLAIDLSLPSLCYAKRQTRALGIRNIEYGQADILKLGALGRKFDVVDCSGVLHHLADPLAGWRVLLSLLRPDGIMRVALYSEFARRSVVAARTFVAERGYSASADDIRRFRQDVLALPDGDLTKQVVRTGDFFSISECRDLVFHVQEHRFTLPQIKDFLTQNNLNFIGFDMFQNMANQYSTRFPHDRAHTNLDLWHVFEQHNPLTFGAMYQFWVQQGRAGP